MIAFAERALWLDYDNDAYRDVFVDLYEANLLYHNKRPRVQHTTASNNTAFDSSLRVEAVKLIGAEK